MFYKIENNYFSAEINSIGAKLHSFKSKIDETEYIYQGNASFQVPILFPIVGNLLNGKYRLNGIEYSMPENGFMNTKEFRALNIEGDYALFLFESNEDTKLIYPFDFELYVSFKISDCRIKVIYEIINKNESEMYFSIGAQPGFKCNIGDSLVFEKKETLYGLKLDGNHILTKNITPILNHGKTLILREELFESDVLILNSYKSSTVTLKNRKCGYSVVLDYGNAPYLIICSKPEATFVSIAPCYGINDNYEEMNDISKKIGIQMLNKGERFRQIWSAKINIL